MTDSVYLDHNATTPVDPRVRAAMVPWLGELHGNPSSAHRFGRQAHGAVEWARDEVAALLGGDSTEVVFTASGTEGNNAVLFSVGRNAGFSGRIVATALEHPSIREAAERCADRGMDVVTIDPGADGVVEVESVLAAVDEATCLVCVMLASNEVGTIQPVAEIAAACRRLGVPVLCDAVQAVGKIPVDVQPLGADYVTLGGHKFHGPYGAAAVWIRPQAAFSALLVGGGQERHRRASTINVSAVVGLGEACRLAREELEERRDWLVAMQARFEAGLAEIGGAVIHGRNSPRLPHTTHVAFSGVEGAVLAIRLDLAGYAVSTGAACSSGKVEASRTLLAMGMEPAEAIASIRVSFGLTNTLDEVERFLPILAREVAVLRGHEERA